MIEGYPSSVHVTGNKKVSRPKFSNLLSIGRQAKKTAHQSPSSVFCADGNSLYDVGVDIK